MENLGLKFRYFTNKVLLLCFILNLSCKGDNWEKVKQKCEHLFNNIFYNF